MQKFYKAKFALTILLFSAFTITAQKNNYWSSHKGLENIITDKAVSRLAFPKTFKLFDLNAAAIKQDLFTVVSPNASKHSTIISLPNAARRVLTAVNEDEVGFVA